MGLFNFHFDKKTADLYFRRAIYSIELKNPEKAVERFIAAFDLGNTDALDELLKLKALHHLGANDVAQINAIARKYYSGNSVVKQKINAFNAPEPSVKPAELDQLRQKLAIPFDHAAEGRKAFELKEWRKAIDHLKQAEETAQNCFMIFEAIDALLPANPADKPELLRMGLDYLAKAANQDYAPAQFRYALTYNYETSVDFANKSLHWLCKAYNNGDNRACRNIFVIYKHYKDDKQANEWLKRGAQHGDQLCQYYYAEDLKNAGLVDEAMEWHKKAAAQDYIPSVVELARILNNRNLKKQAIQLLQPYADRNITSCQQELGTVLFNMADYKKAEPYLSSAAEKGDVWAQVLGGLTLLRLGKLGPAAVLLRRALPNSEYNAACGLVAYAELTGDAALLQKMTPIVMKAPASRFFAEISLILLYVSEKKKARPWLKLSASAGNLASQSRYFGILIREGEFAEAANVVRNSAFKGDLVSQYNLGYAYYKGGKTFFGPDWDKHASFWALRSAQQGNKEAIRLLNEIKKEKATDSWQGFFKMAVKEVAKECAADMAGDFTEDAISNWIDGPLGQILAESAGTAVSEIIKADPSDYS